MKVEKKINNNILEVIVEMDMLKGKEKKEKLLVSDIMILMQDEGYKIKDVLTRGMVCNYNPKRLKGIFTFELIEEKKYHKWSDIKKRNIGEEVLQGIKEIKEEKEDLVSYNVAYAAQFPEEFDSEITYIKNSTEEKDISLTKEVRTKKKK